MSNNENPAESKDSTMTNAQHRSDIRDEPQVVVSGRFSRRWSRFSSSLTDNVVARWAFKNIYDIIWGYNTALSTVTSLGILLNMFMYKFTLGSMVVDVLVLIMFPLTVLLWEVLLYFGDQHNSVILLSTLFVVNMFPYVIAVYVLSKIWHWYPYAQSRVIFSILVIVAYTGFVVISEVFLYWKIWKIKLQNSSVIMAFRH